MPNPQLNKDERDNGSFRSISACSISSRIHPWSHGIHSDGSTAPLAVDSSRQTGSKKGTSRECHEKKRTSQKCQEKTGTSGEEC